MPAIDETISVNTIAVNCNNNNNNLETNSTTIVSILHFNDCYNVESRGEEPTGGAARMATAFGTHRHCDPLVLFSGDIMAPSIMSTFTKGRQMVPVLHTLAVDCALFGNHEFDFGVDHLKSFVSKTRFPWLMSNVYDTQTARPLGSAHKWHIVYKNCKKLGIIGLVEKQWLADAIDWNYTYRDFVSEGRILAKHLKEKESVDFVIALTHMRWPNDCLLAESVPEIDLILGGHDHDYEIRKINNKYCIKSGTDFRTFSKIDIEFKTSGKYEIKCKKISVNSFDFEEDIELKQELQKYSNEVEFKLDALLCHINTDLNANFATIRSRETNLGNFISDIVLVSTGADAVVLNSGTFRSDQIQPKGAFSFRDLVRILPMMDELVVLNVTGSQLWQTLECGVARWPQLDGSFPQVSNIRFAYDPRKPVGTRINANEIKIGNEFLDSQKTYRLVTKEFLHKGKDGYHVLVDCPVVMCSEECPNLFTTVKNYFESISQLKAKNNNHLDSSGQTLVSSALNTTHISTLANELRKLEPKVDGRITCLPQY